MSIIELFTLIFTQPLFNGLILITNLIPTTDVGVGIVLLTLLVKALIFPVTHKGVKTQAALKRLEPELKSIKEKHKNNKEEMARKTMELYKAHGINPFSGCLFGFIQLPIILGLYYAFIHGFSGGDLNTDLLYSFVGAPETISYFFFGFIDVRTTSIALALVAGVLQFFQMHLSLPSTSSTSLDGKKISEQSFAEAFQTALPRQMKYILPVMVVVFSFTFPSAIALYWATSAAFSIGHELFVKKEARLLWSGRGGKLAA
jgi:YidC/Oxa1 family membrane protein insertase